MASISVQGASTVADHGWLLSIHVDLVIILNVLESYCNDLAFAILSGRLFLRFVALRTVQQL